MNLPNPLEMVAYALWLSRDLFVFTALFLAVLGLFSQRDRQNAGVLWIWSVLATIASVAVGQTKSLLNIPFALIVVTVVIAGVLIFSRSLKARKGNGFHRATRTSSVPAEQSYFRRSSLLTTAENSFYQTLLQVTQGRVTVCPKVGLWDIFDVENEAKAFAAKSRIDRKHVDFLLCDPHSMQPVAAIELDDSSHNRSDRRERDRFVNEVFQTTALPLVRIRVQRVYDAATLAQTLSPYVGNVNTRPSPDPEVPPASIRVSADGKPLCPKCGAPMVIRVAKRGEHQGEKFYACSTYPECRGILPIK